MKFGKFVLIFLLLFVMSAAGHGQVKYNYDAQKAFIHKDLGKVYLGMPFTDFVKLIDISKADAGYGRFNHLNLEIPYKKGSIEDVVVSVHGIDAAMQEQIITKTRGIRKNYEGEEIETDIYIVDAKKIPTNAFVYAITIQFKPDFDAKTYVYKTFGKGGTEHDPADDHKFYDTQWVMRTSDDLLWMIRSFHEGADRRLQLIGRISGTPWGLDDIDNDL